MRQVLVYLLYHGAEKGFLEKTHGRSGGFKIFFAQLAGKVLTRYTMGAIINLTPASWGDREGESPPGLIFENKIERRAKERKAGLWGSNALETFE